MYLNLLKIILRKAIPIFFKITWVIGYSFLILWLSLLPIPNVWLMLWPLWSVWFVLVISEILPPYLFMGLAWLIGMMLDSLSGTLIGVHAIALTLTSYLKYCLSWTTQMEFAENVHEIVPVAGLCFLYQIVVGILEWTTNIPVKLLISHLICTTVTTTVLWYYCTSAIKMIYVCRALDKLLSQALWVD